MPSARYILFASDDAWRIGVASSAEPAVLILDRPSDPDPAVAASAAADRLVQEGYTGEGVVLGLPSNWCLSATISTGALRRQTSGEAMRFRLEEKLPIAAEDLVADFIRHDARSGHENLSETRNDQVGGGAALGVCAIAPTLQRIVQTLETRGVAVQSICPAALLAAQSLGDLLMQRDLLAWQVGEAVELVGLREGRPLHWRIAPSEIDAFDRQLSAYAFMEPETARICARGLDGELAECLLTTKGWSTDQGEACPWAAATATGGLILAGTTTPWIELRRDALAASDPLRQLRRSLTVAASAAVLCLLCTAAALLWRAGRYEAIANLEEVKQHRLFEEAFPKVEAPIDVAGRLRAEERRLRALGGGESVAAKPSALRLLHDVLAALPKDLRYRILELRLEDGQLYVEGQTRSHGDAEALATALGRAGQFALEPPRSEQRGDGRDQQSVWFTLSGATHASGAGISRQIQKGEQ